MPFVIFHINFHFCQMDHSLPLRSSQYLINMWNRFSIPSLTMEVIESACVPGVSLQLGTFCTYEKNIEIAVLTKGVIPLISMKAVDLQ